MKNQFNIISAAVTSLMLASCPLAYSAPNTLSSREISDGWILLFDGESLFGWAPHGEAPWTVSEGCLSPCQGDEEGFLATTTEFADFDLTVEYWAEAGTNGGVFLRSPLKKGINPFSSTEVVIGNSEASWPAGSLNKVSPAKSGVEKAGYWNHLQIKVLGPQITVDLNGETVLQASDWRHQRGGIALNKPSGNGSIRFRNLKLRPRGLKSLFNGRDLTGWQEIPGRKSVYSVTPEGWLNVKDGNGDLQTTTRYGDFIFQLDIIVNGTHLNSGVFFRALPGEFWSGYESQIRNQWKEGDRTQPVDFGTGGIYNRQPARRVVSSDRQWFTKTIVAHGRHLAVWVNGKQVSDFSDPRAPHENARKGYRSEPGVISLQGHDPTTDLSFRKLKIMEMPKAR